MIHRPTKAEMAMKVSWVEIYILYNMRQQIRLEISESTFNHILLELDVLHKSHSKFIVDFYGAFFIESTVNICMEVRSHDILPPTKCSTWMLDLWTVSMVKVYPNQCLRKLLIPCVQRRLFEHIKSLLRWCVA